MKKFEYLTSGDKLSDYELNRLGGKGWELVSHSAAVGARFVQYYVFKREITE